MPPALLSPGYFTAPVDETDTVIAQAIAREKTRTRDVIELIASENIVSRAVLDVQGSILTNKTVEGYPGKRYHAGAVNVDVVESTAIERACQLFGCRFANVQSHSGSQANHAVLHAVAAPGDTILSMNLNAGGHLSHGASANFSSKWFNIVSYGVRAEDGLIDYDEVVALARKHQPKLVIAGGSAYPRALDFTAFRRAADAGGAKLLVDMAHFAGLVAGGAHESPFPHADIVTTTTYKSLRGPRGAIILWNAEALRKPINNAVFPGLQGGPLMHVIAAKAVAFGEALKPEFKLYAQNVVANAKALAAVMIERGCAIVSGGTDNHLMLVDLRPKKLTGKNIWDERLSDIANYEDYLARNGIVLRKIFLNISREEQKKRLLARVEDPDKMWKFSPDDLRDRGRWPDFMAAYGAAIKATASKTAPWYVVPADDKPFARLVVARIAVEPDDADEYHLTVGDGRRGACGSVGHGEESRRHQLQRAGHNQHTERQDQRRPARPLDTRSRQPRTPRRSTTGPWAATTRKPGARAIGNARNAGDHHRPRNTETTADYAATGDDDDRRTASAYSAAAPYDGVGYAGRHAVRAACNPIRGRRRPSCRGLSARAGECR